MAWNFIVHPEIRGKSDDVRPTTIEYAILGLLAISITAIILNFFTAIPQWLSATILIVSFSVGTIQVYRNPIKHYSKLIALVVVITLFTFWGASFILGYDAGLYHLQAISWMKEEPIVFGLANLHDRFGFNSLWFSALAVFWVPWYEVKGMLLANYLPAVLLLLTLLSHLLDRPKNNSSALSVSSIFALICLASLSVSPGLLLTPSTSTDIVPTTYTLLSAFMFLRAFERNKHTEAVVYVDNMMLWSVAIFAVLSKLSAITPGLLALFYTLYFRKMLGIQTLKRTILLLLMVSGIWILRNFILSGCLVYPAGVTCVDRDLIDWSIGSDSANKMRNIIEMWAKAPGENYLLNGASSQWLDRWLLNPIRGGVLIDSILRTLGIAAIIFLYLLFLFILRGSPRADREAHDKRVLIGAIITTLAAAVGIIFGFLSAPDPRFWSGPLITLLVMLVSMLCYMFFRHGINLGPLTVLPVIFLASSLTGTYVLMKNLPWKNTLNPINAHQEMDLQIQTASKPAMGFFVRMPIEDERCWMAAKPCTPQNPSGLKQYRIGSYRAFTRDHTVQFQTQ